MHPNLVTCLRGLPPLEILSCGDIERLYPHQAFKLHRDLKQLSASFPPCGDQSNFNDPLAWFGIRWIVASAPDPFPRQEWRTPLDVASMSELFPELEPKLARLGVAIVFPDLMNEFLAAIRLWIPTPNKAMEAQP